MQSQVLISLTKSELEEIITKAVERALETKEDDKLLNFKETCEYLGISASALNKWKSENKIPYKKLGKRIFFDKKEINKALEESNYSKLKQIERGKE